MVPNSIKKAIRIVSEKIFSVWWSWYYRFFRHAPKRYYKNDDWMLEHWEENPFDPICFPLPLRINCLGCMGCRIVSFPPLGEDVPKGPYKVLFSDLFLQQYEKMFGKQAVFELVWDMKKQNDQVDLIHLAENKGI